ncbi:MAG: hypothetical protein AAF411_25680 [Myxococcota bacterium]
MRHPLFHTLVVSSLSLVEGCAESTLRPVDPARPDAGADVSSHDGALSDAAPSLDAVPSLDAGTPLDEALPSPLRPPDAASAFDAFVRGTPDACEAGWPPTKGLRLCQLVDDSGMAILRCVYPDPLTTDPSECEVALREQPDGVARYECAREDEIPCAIEDGELACGDERCVLQDEDFQPRSWPNSEDLGR